MKSNFIQILISAENKKQANQILNALLKDKLVIGGLMIESPSKFWWKGKIIKINYCNIVTFSMEKHVKRIIEKVKEISIEEVPMVSATTILYGNKEFFNWISSTIG